MKGNTLTLMTVHAHSDDEAISAGDLTQVRECLGHHITLSRNTHHSKILLALPRSGR